MAESKSLFELFILGRLMAQPFHGYLLRQMLSVAIGPTRQISWGILYPLIRHMEDDGLIVAAAVDEAPSHDGPENERQRRAYQITEAGRARFHELMLQLGEYNTNYADWFSIKLSCFAYVERERQIEILRHYRGYLLHVRQHLNTARQHVASIPAIRDFERVHYLRMLDHKLYVLAADLSWVESEIGTQGA